MRVRAELAVCMVLALAASAIASPQNSATAPSRTARRNGSIAGRIIHPDGAAAEGARIAVYAVVEDAPGATSPSPTRLQGRLA